MKLTLLALSLLLTITNIPAEEIREYYFGYPTDKIKSYTLYGEGELGERLIKIDFDTNGNIVSSKSPKFTLTFKNEEMVAAEKDGKRMEFRTLLGVTLPTKYVDLTNKIDLTYSISPKDNVIIGSGTSDGNQVHFGNSIDGNMPTKLGKEEINKFYFDSMSELTEVWFMSQIAKDETLHTATVE